MTKRVVRVAIPIQEAQCAIAVLDREVNSLQRRRERMGAVPEHSEASQTALSLTRRATLLIRTANALRRGLSVAALILLTGCATMDQHRVACGLNAEGPPPGPRYRVVGAWPNERWVPEPELPAEVDRAMVEACAQQRAAGERLAAATALAFVAGAALGVAATASAYPRPRYVRHAPPPSRWAPRSRWR